jgi:predicted metal-dependent hydrolase
VSSERDIYHEGIRLFNAHEFFEAHETWEDAWNMAYGLKHEFYQGLIQCAVALEHYHRSNARGVHSLFKSYTHRLKNIPPIFMGLDVKNFLQKMHETLRPVLELTPIPDRGVITLDHSTVPKIELLYDPFETGEAEKFDKPEKF